MTWEFPEYPENWDKISKACIARDGYHCVNCGQKQGGRYKLNAHHIISPRHGGGHELSNLITLCEGCHASVHPHLAHVRRDIEPAPLTQEYYNAISLVEELSKELKKVPKENLPLKCVDIDFDSFYNDPQAVGIYAKMYGGYSCGVHHLGNKKFWRVYISKNENTEQAKNLVGIVVARLLKLVDEKLEFINNIRIDIEDMKMDIKKLKEQEGKLNEEISKLDGEIRELTDRRDKLNEELHNIRKKNEGSINKLSELRNIKKKIETGIKVTTSQVQEIKEFSVIYGVYNKRYFILITIIFLLLILFIKTFILL